MPAVNPFAHAFPFHLLMLPPQVPRRSSLAFRAALKELWCSGGVEKVYRECLSNSLSHHNSKQ